MRDEVDAASRWWTTQLGKAVTDEQVLETFRRCLGEVMTERYTGHWYEDDRLRGSGFRSISFDNRVDPVLITAAKRAGIDSKMMNGKEKPAAEPTEVEKVMSKLLDHARGKIMFINPGEVKLANAALLSAPARCLWDRANGANKNGIEWDEDTTPTYKTQFDGDTFESPLASPPSTPHIAPVPSSSSSSSSAAIAVASLPSPTKSSMQTPSGSQPREFYPAQQSNFKMPLERLDERGSTSSNDTSPSGATLGPFSPSFSHNHNLNLTHSHNLNVKNGAIPPRQNYAPPPSHLGPNPHAVSAHNHHTTHSHHANLGNR